MKLIIIPAFALLLAAGAAHAGPTQYDKQIREPIATVNGGRYWALFGGVNANQSADINDSSNRLGKFRNELDSDTGYFGGVKLGYEYPSTGWAAMALEVEALYTRLDAEASSKSGGFKLQSSGEISAAVFMANALVKFRPIGPVRPYVGGGVGVAHLWLKNTDSVVTFRGTRTGTLPRDDAKDWTLAYQGIAGLDWQVTDHWSLFAEYKALVFHDAVGIDRFLNHLVGVGVRVGF
jgi:opacity protein-like surface antigen